MKRALERNEHDSDSSVPKRRRKNPPLHISQYVGLKRRRDLERIETRSMPQDHPAKQACPEETRTLEAMPAEILRHMASFLPRVDCFSLAQMNHRMRVIALESTFQDYRVNVRNTEQLRVLVSVYEKLPMIGLYTKALYIREVYPDMLDIAGLAAFFERFQFVFVGDNGHAFWLTESSQPVKKICWTLDRLDKACEPPFYVIGDARRFSRNSRWHVITPPHGWRERKEQSEPFPPIAAMSRGIISNAVLDLQSGMSGALPDQPAVFHTMYIEVAVDLRFIDRPEGNWAFDGLLKRLHKYFGQKDRDVYVHKLVLTFQPLDAAKWTQDLALDAMDGYFAKLAGAINACGILRDQHGFEEMLGADALYYPSSFRIPEQVICDFTRIWHSNPRAHRYIRVPVCDGVMDTRFEL